MVTAHPGLDLARQVKGSQFQTDDFKTYGPSRRLECLQLSGPRGNSVLSGSVACCELNRWDIAPAGVESPVVIQVRNKAPDM